jgi:hypothetical protein
VLLTNSRPLDLSFLFRQVSAIFTASEQEDLRRLGTATQDGELLARNDERTREGVLDQGGGSK